MGRVKGKPTGAVKYPNHSHCRDPVPLPRPPGLRMGASKESGSWNPEKLKLLERVERPTFHEPWPWVRSQPELTWQGRSWGQIT